MVGTAGTGFMQGFAQTSLALRQYQDQQAHQQAELDLQKEHLNLQRDVLKGHEATQKIQNQVLQQNLTKLLKTQAFGEQVSALFGQGKDLDDPAVQQQIMQGLVTTGGVQPFLAFQDFLQQRQQLKLFQQMAQRWASVPTAPAPTPTIPLSGEAPAPAATAATPPVVPPAGVAPAASPPSTVPLADRLNNPLNMKYGPATKYLVDQGIATVGPAATDGGNFLRFTTLETGFQSADTLFQSPVYNGLPLNDALQKWSNGGYDARILQGMGIAPTLPVSQLTPPQRQAVLQRMAAIERGGSPAPNASQIAAGPATPAPPVLLPQGTPEIVPGAHPEQPAQVAYPLGQGAPPAVATDPNVLARRLGEANQAVAFLQSRVQQASTPALQQLLTAAQGERDALLQQLQGGGVPEASGQKAPSQVPTIPAVAAQTVPGTTLPQVVRPAPAPPPSASAADTLRLQGLESQRNQLQQHLDEMTTLRPVVFGKVGEQLDKQIDEVRKNLQLKEEQIKNERTRFTSRTDDTGRLLYSWYGVTPDSATPPQMARVDEEIRQRRLEDRKAERENAATIELQKVMKEPAPEEVIKEANRSLPPDKQLPSRATNEEVRKANVIPKSQLPPKLQDDLFEFDQDIQLLKEAQAITDPNAVGPIAGRLERFKQMTGIDVGDARTRQSAIIAHITNAIAHKLFGARLTKTEIGRLERALPNQLDPAPVFDEKMRSALAIYQDSADRRRFTWQKAGYQVIEPYQPGATIVGPSPAELRQSLDILKQAVK